MDRRSSKVSQHVPDAVIDPALLQSPWSWAPDPRDFPTVQQMGEDVQNSLVRSRRPSDRLVYTDWAQSSPSDAPRSASQMLWQESNPQMPRKRKRRSNGPLQTPQSPARRQTQHPIAATSGQNWESGNRYALLSMDRGYPSFGQDEDETLLTPEPPLFDHEIYPTPQDSANARHQWSHFFTSPPPGPTMEGHFGQAGHRMQLKSPMSDTPAHVHGWPSAIPPAQNMGLWNTGAFSLSDSVADRSTPMSPTPNRSYARALSMTNSTTTYTCTSEGCDKTFGTQSDLKRHQRYHNKDTRDKICPICKVDFLFPKDLSRHMRTHDSTRPFHCDVATCEYSTKGFPRKDHLKRHKKTHTKAIPTPSASSYTISRQPSAYG